MTDTYKAEMALLAACEKMLRVLDCLEITRSQHEELWELKVQLNETWLDYVTRYNHQNKK